MTAVQCPFDGPHNLRPEDPCPACGDLGHLPEEYEESSHSNCVHDRGHRMTDTTERIAAAACKVEGMTCSMSPPHRHHHVMKAIWHMNRKLGAVPPQNQGFITNTGRFVGRKEACIIARKAGQILEKTGPSDVLFSEDLWRLRQSNCASKSSKRTGSSPR